MNLADTHCHLDFEKFDPDRGEVLERAWQAGLTRILIPGLDLASSRQALELAGGHPNIYAAAGVHPSEARKFDQSTLEELRALHNGEHGGRLVAIGEIGLDYYWDDAPHDTQRKALAAQLGLAAELNLPVVLHMREAGDAPQGDCARDMLQILQDWTASLRAQRRPLAQNPGVLHSFSGSAEVARQTLALNFMIGITGPVTFKNADVRREVVKSLPLERLLVETDAPFLAPVPQRGRRNEPAFVRHIADKIAEIHNKTPEEVAAQTSLNAVHLFSW